MGQFCRATFFLEDGAYAWTETHYVIGSPPNLTEPLKIARTLADARTMLLPTYSGDMGPGGGPQMTELRVSFDDVWRDSLIDPNVKRGSPGAKYNKELEEDPNPRPEVPYSTALIRLQAGSLYRRSMYMSGVPQKIIIDPNGPFAGNDAAWLSAFNKYKKLLAGDGTNWGFKVALKTGDGVTEKFITGVQIAAGLVTLTIPNHNFPLLNPDGSFPTVIIRGAKLTPSRPTFGGRHIYTVIDANHISVPVTGLNAALVESAGIARPLIYQVKTYTSCDLVGQTHRKRGVRSGRPLGRSKSRN
jgi:hypothetical protein